MSRFRILVLISVIMFVATASGSAYQMSGGEQATPRIVVEFSESGIAQINTQLINDTPVELTIKNSPITPESFPYESPYQGGNWPGWGGWWGATQTAVTGFRVKIGKKEFYPRMSAWGDLGGAHTVIFEDTSLFYTWTRDEQEHVETERASFRVIIRGGDAGVSYSAQLEFSDQFLERRSVWLNETPADVLEVTIY